eukprot:CAMPEP_0119323342 /NCGR_PEP_ID=MMETSP1333-20130426/60487_1 /TAXON_ID=418940 /ORGANISM="Scyphosphaera apsteinii, Strain RCC1455" /LENGTH=112 /DNA_ID=CAMNT_0007330759 /DNA_START=24 /DNA_END=359 /DNA_ORIENTATION=+
MILWLAALGASASSLLEHKVQAFIREQAQLLGFAIQVAYHSETLAFTVAAGESKYGTVSTKDRFLFGSGTKTYTASSVLRFIESGKVASLDASAVPTVDLALRKLGSNSSFK